MNSSFTYPVVSYGDIISLFHSILFWRYEEKSARGAHQKFWFVTFNTVWGLLNMGHILPKRRIERLRGKKELCVLFLKQTFVIEQWDNRDFNFLLKEGSLAFKCFCIRKGNRELISGNRVNHLELCSRTKIHITPFGIRTAPRATEIISHLLTQERFQELWETYTAPFREKQALLGSLLKERNQELDEEIWGKEAEEGKETA